MVGGGGAIALYRELLSIMAGKSFFMPLTITKVQGPWPWDYMKPRYQSKCIHAILKMYIHTILSM